MEESTNETYVESLDPDNNYFSENSTNFSSYNVETFKSNGISKKGSLNIMHHNSRSILKEGRIDDYNILLNAINNPFHVMGFTETWLDCNNVDCASFNGFTATHSVRMDNDILKETGGGLSIFVRDGIDFKVRENMKLMLPYIETLFIEFSYEGKEYMIGLIYRVPNTNVKDFIESLDNLIEPLRNSHELILMGDFNICLLQDDNRTKSFCNTMLTHKLFPTILEPTRVATVLRNGNYITTNTLIDNIFIDTQLTYKSGLIYSCISDHYPVTISIETTNTARQIEPSIIRYRVIDDFSVRKFRFAINTQLLNVIMEASDAATAFTEFFTKFNDLYEKYFPVKTRIAKQKEILKPWVTQSLVKRIKIRDKLGKLANKGRINRSIFKTFRNLLNTQLREAKAQFYHAEFYKFKGDIKKTWGTINETIRKKKAYNKITINENNNIVEQADVPNKFCNYFTTIADEIVSQIPISDVNPESFLKDRELNSFFMIPITNDETEKSIMELKDNGCGLFKFSTKVLIAIRDILAPILSHIFNLCISQSYFPYELKTGCITPVFKKGDKSDMKNYRPVCSLSPISKIFEKIIYLRMITFIEKNKIFSDNQFGFRKMKSTETALMKFMDFIHNGLSKKQNVGTIFMDLSKAFDVMNHNILKLKLEHYGFRGVILDFIMSFVRDRKYFVNVNGINSISRTVNIGVPQGSTLGPLLFLLYVNDMENSSAIIDFVLFADDTTIMYSCDDFNQLQSTLEAEGNKVIEWLKANKLVINLTKTQSMLFSFKRGNPNFSLNLENAIIEEQQVTTFLGVLIDNKLTWKSHIAHLCSKISKAIAILRLLRPSFPKNILKMIYMSLIYSYFNYCNLIWGAAENSIIDPLFKLQKKAVRIINKSNYLDHTKPIFMSLKLLTVHQIYDYNCLLFAFKCIICNLFPSHKKRISQCQTVHHYNTRRRENYRTDAMARLRICQRSFLFHGVRLWNSINESLKEVHTLSVFKEKIKQYIFGKCE